MIRSEMRRTFSFLICASSSGVKSLTMLNNLRISSGVLPLIMFATVLQPTSLKLTKQVSAASLRTAHAGHTVGA